MTGTGRDKFPVYQLKLSLPSHLESTVSSHLVLLVEVNNVGGVGLGAQQRILQRERVW
jgi:hypothetical protein